MAGDFSCAELAEAFEARVQELKKYAYLRVDGRTFARDLEGLETSIKALEIHVSALRSYVQNENLTVPKVEALLEALRLQSDDIATTSRSAPCCLAQPDARVPSDTAAVSDTVSRRDDDKPKRGDTAPPRWHVTEAEFDSIGSYMKGRLPLEKVNAAIDEMAMHSEANSKLLSALRSSSQKMPNADRKRATELLHSVAGKEGIKGRHFVVEADLKNGLVLRLDKTSKAILVMLRHLGRIQEMRCSLEGAPCTVYVLVHP